MPTYFTKSGNGLSQERFQIAYFINTFGNLQESRKLFRILLMMSAGLWGRLIAWAHWSRMTHIFVSKLTITGSSNDLSTCHQANFWTNVRILLIRSIETSEILNVILFNKMNLKMSVKLWPQLSIETWKMKIHTCNRGMITRANSSSGFRICYSMLKNYAPRIKDFWGLEGCQLKSYMYFPVSEI